MKINEIINIKHVEFTKLCQTHKVKSIYAFGSSVTNNFDEQNSDIDLLVEINTSDPLERGEQLLQLWDKLEGFFNRKVDVLTPSSIKSPILKKKHRPNQNIDL